MLKLSYREIEKIIEFSYSIISLINEELCYLIDINKISKDL
ncbi:hypothetical protein SAMN02745196_03065 [Clostridium collagenovorans DSM 3089]|uniref:Uncharacterized protein n=1 Tax=Clostridium collagenovorans DSM 3089 TaxID=1121306 RepID=A0A1M5YLS7_9CLOT|nr:hypothetical protein SAMN02745196_03065 [Clostridium collagenovorans DSM 3089]